MKLEPGRSIGHFRIVTPLGAGGMGEVYRATDTRLGRDVAIKALPADLAGQPERLARFRREAQLLASLSHPNIAAIHGLEEIEGRPRMSSTVMNRCIHQREPGSRSRSTCRAPASRRNRAPSPDPRTPPAPRRD
jgi:serine/threonine protein kinase